MQFLSQTLLVNNAISFGFIREQIFKKLGFCGVTKLSGYSINTGNQGSPVQIQLVY